MYKLTDRVSMLREEAVHTRKYEENYLLQRQVYFSQGMLLAEAAGLSPFEITASGITNTIEKFTPFIIPGELITGFN